MENLYLRNADMKDLLFVYHLANESEVRNNSLNTNKISIDEHKKWFQNILNAKKASLYILMDSDIAVGQGRLEIVNGKCRISYSIVPDRRGRGYGKKLLNLLLKKMKEDYPECKICYAEVLAGNVASRKIFEELMFERAEYGTENDCLIYENRMG